MPEPQTLFDRCSRRKAACPRSAMPTCRRLADTGRQHATHDTSSPPLATSARSTAALIATAPNWGPVRLRELALEAPIGGTGDGYDYDWIGHAILPENAAQTGCIGLKRLDASA